MWISFSDLALKVILVSRRSVLAADLSILTHFEEHHLNSIAAFHSSECVRESGARQFSLWNQKASSPSPPESLRRN